MGKIKLNLVSGAVVEKPLVCGFKANNIEYVVLDNEMNGSMGLPIILVCKIDNNKVTKIVDPNEWQLVKEYLKNIIAGSIVEFVPVAKEMTADDIYYTQLTLPVPSFDALKKAYPIEDTESSNTATILDINPMPNQTVTPTPSSPVGPTSSVGPVAPEPITLQPEPIPVSPVNPSPIPNVTPTEPVTPNPIPATPVEPPVTPTPVVNPTTPVTGPTPEQIMQNPTSPIIDFATPIAPEPTQTPVASQTVVEPTALEAQTINPAPSAPATPVEPPVNNNSQVISGPTPIDAKELFKDQKEAFMQACENMFDALVQKFEKELQNK